MGVMCEVCRQDPAALVVPMSCRPRAACELCAPLLAAERMPVRSAVAA